MRGAKGVADDRARPERVRPDAIAGVTGARAYSDEQREHGGGAVTPLQYFGRARFWYESLQNWQSEFLAVGSMVVLSIFLRERGSPESKPVAAPHQATGK